MIATRTRTTKAGTIQRIIDVSDALNGLALATVNEIHQDGKKITCGLYWLRRQASQIGGIAFTVEKGEDRTVYDVLLNAPGGGHTCDCPHGNYRGHQKPCRHVEACLQAIRERKL